MRLGRCAGTRVVVLTFAVLAALLVAPTSAGAHAYVVRADPPNGALLKTSPGRVTVVWDEPITLGLGGARAALGVYAPSGRRVDSGNVEHPAGDTLTVSLPPHLAHGTYTVGWKVTSADTHVVNGAFTFSVGTRTASGSVARKLLASQEVPLALSDGFAVVRFLNLLLLLLCAGGAASIVFVQRETAPAVRARLWALVVLCAIGLAAVALLGLPFEAAAQDGTGLLKGIEANAIAGVRRTRFGEVWLARAWLALIIAALAFSLERWTPARRARELLLLGAAVALLLTPSASGHANVSGTLTFLVDALHVLSAAAWGGGLAFLAAGLAFTPRGERWPLAARIVPRFSAMALGSVALLLAAGGANAYLEVRAFRGFVDSTYGALVLVKIALAIPLLALGAFNNRVSVPRLRTGLGSVEAHRRFARAVGAELLVFAVIIAVTAVLIDEAPARNVPAPPAGPVSSQTTVGPFTATVRVAPARAGVNTIDVKLTNRRGRPAHIAEVTVAATLPSRSLGPLNYTAMGLGGGRFRVTGARLAIAGDWLLQLGVRQGQFNEWLRNVPVTIGS